MDASSRVAKGSVYWITVATLFGAFTYGVVEIENLSHDLSRAEKDRVALSKQVERLGATPVAGPRGKPGKGSKGPAGRPGDDGADGADGRDGKHGKDGTDGRDGINGRDGIDGKDGKDGIDGKDGKNGIDGKDGAPGAQGPRGEAGPPGRSACPEGYYPTQLNLPNGRTTGSYWVCGQGV